MDSYQLAQKALAELERAVLFELGKVASGMTNGDLTRNLSLESDQDGKQKNYLCWSVLGRLMKAGKVKRIQPDGRATKIILYKVVV